MGRAQAWIENTLRRHPWVIPLVAMVPCAFFAARGSTDLVAARLFAADTEALARPLPPSALAIETDRAPVENRHVRSPAAIIHRNIFDSDAGCLDCDGSIVVIDGSVVEVAGGGGGPTAPAGPEEILEPEACITDRHRDPNPAHVGMHRPDPCDTQAKILGAVESDQEEWSFVFVLPGPSSSTAPPAPGAPPAGPPTTMPYRMGQALEGRTVSVVSWCPALGAYVLLRPATGPRCFLAQNMPPHAAPPPPPPAGTPSAAGSELSSIVDQGLERVGPNEFNIRRQTVDRILENQAELMRTTRIMPHEENGHVTGVQLFGVRPNTLLGRIGLQNGDLLNRINGLDIASPDRALEAYSRLRSSDHLQVSVTRNGQPVNIDFNIR